MTDPATTWLALTSLLPLNELIAAGDHLVHEPVYPVAGEARPYVTLDELRRRTVDHSGRGKRTAVHAVELLSVRAESRPESLLRMLLHDAGLPAPEVNPSIRDHRGSAIGRADLVFRAARLIVEYDGQQHRTDSNQYEKDSARLELFHLDDWHVIRVRHSGLFSHPQRTVAHIRDTLTRLEASKGPELLSTGPERSS